LSAATLVKIRDRHDIHASSSFFSPLLFRPACSRTVHPQRFFAITLDICFFSSTHHTITLFFLSYIFTLLFFDADAAASFLYQHEHVMPMRWSASFSFRRARNMATVIYHHFPRCSSVTTPHHHCRRHMRVVEVILLRAARRYTAAMPCC